MELVYMLLLESRFYRFDSCLGYMRNKILEALIEKFESRAKSLLGPEYQVIVGIQQPEDLTTGQRVGYVHILASVKDISSDKHSFRTMYKTDGVVLTKDVRAAIKDFLYLLVMENSLLKTEK